MFRSPKAFTAAQFFSLPDELHCEVLYFIMLEPYRTLGLINGNTSIPFLQRRSTEHFITCAVESVLQVYDVSKLRLKGCSPMLVSNGSDSVIHHIVAWKDWTFAASYQSILVFDRLQFKEKWIEHTGNISNLLLFGNILLSVSVTEQRVIIWDLEERQKFSEFYLPVGFNVTCVEHPDTYVNKVLFGSTSGSLQLWNIRNFRLLYEYSSLGSSITCLRSSPALDVVAVGLANGRTVLYHLRKDRQVMEFEHSVGHSSVPMSSLLDTLSTSGKSECGVLDISFRTDGIPEMAVSYMDGTIVFFNLKQQEVKYSLNNVHFGGTFFLRFLYGQPVLITAGKHDNCLKVHIFDRDMEPPRLLRFREGHVLPPFRLRFPGDDSRILLSCSMDHDLRVISLFRDARSRAFSQQVSSLIGGKRKRKRMRQQKMIEIGAPLRFREDIRGYLPRICALASGTLRRRDNEFADIVTCHEGLLEAYCWKLENGRLTPKVLVRGVDHSKSKQSTEQALYVTVSSCGNFAVIGTNLGNLDLYNLQSGSHRASFMDPKCIPFAHQLAVGGVAFDSLGEILVSGSHDRLLKFWNRQEAKLLNCIQLFSGIIQIEWGYSCNLLAVLCDDFDIYIVDPETKQIGRRFHGHEGSLTDVQFSADGYFLLSSALDGTIRVWNIQLGYCTDIFEFEHAPLSIAFSPNNDFIATCHANCVGIALWSNSYHFRTSQREYWMKRDELANSTDEQDRYQGVIPHIGAFEWIPCASTHSSLQSIDERSLVAPGSNEDAVSMFTLSGKPLSFLTTLVHWDIIKKRGRPQEPVKKDVEAPFFLPLNSSLDSLMLKMNEDEMQIESTEVLPTGKQIDSIPTISQLIACLQNGDQNGNWEARDKESMDLLKGMTPSGIELEIQSIKDYDNGRELQLFLMFIIRQLQQRKDVDLIESILGVFLKYHGLDLLNCPEIGLELLEQAYKTQERTVEELEYLLDDIFGLTDPFCWI